MSPVFSMVSAVLAVAAAMGGVYLLVALAAVRRFACLPSPALTGSEGVTILKPVCGIDPELRENLLSFCRQDYPGPVQIVIGAHREDDPAVTVARAVIADLPDVAIDLVIDQRLGGSNRKICNLRNMMAVARHDILLISDSDMRVEPDYLRQIVAALEAPNAGLATTLYRARAVGGLASRLGAAFINYGFLPSVLVGRLLNAAPFCSGSTIAIRRDILARIGGFEAMINRLADDYEMGAAVKRLGLEVALARPVVENVVLERGLTTLFRHELRWQRTIRSITPLGLAASVIINPISLASASFVLGSFNPAIGLLLAALLAARLILNYTCDYVFALEPVGTWLIPFRDVLSQLVLAASYLGRNIVWREATLRLDRAGDLEAIPDRVVS